MMLAGLDDARRALLAEARSLLGELQGLLAGLDAEEASRRVLAASIAQLDQPFLLVVVGEFNAGKSAFINALVGQAALDEGVTPTTSRLGLVGYDTVARREVTGPGLERIGLPAEALRDLVIVDTPGTNAVLREHEALTRDFLPRADLVVFLTSADRPFTESERGLLQSIREWGKKVVLVLNKADLLRTSAEREQVTDFVRQQAQRTLGLTLEVYPLSARRALAARLAGDAADLETSGLGAFEARVTATLDEKERFRLKLLNPLGIARRARDAAAAVVEARLGLLAVDVSTLQRVDEDLRTRALEQEADFRLRLSDVDRVLLDFERRGNAFFDERLRLARLRELLGRERLRADFEREVVAELPRDVERRVEALVDWMVASELRQWQDVMGLLAERRAEHAGRLVGKVESRFDYDRQRLLEAVSAEARRAVDGFDAPSEAKRLAQEVREAVARGALLQVGALGLGTAVAALATTTVADVTGILAAGALSLIGLYLLPARRRRARVELAARVSALREKLLGSLNGSFERERERAGARIREAIGPYARFVRTEEERLRQTGATLERLGAALEALAARVRARP